MATTTINQAGNMKIKAIYRKNLKMSEGKVAAQVAHAVSNLHIVDKDTTIVVLGVSDKKFNELLSFYENRQLFPTYVQVDKGLTEVKSGTRTAAAWVDFSPITETVNVLKEIAESKDSDPKNATRMLDNNGEEIEY